MQSLPGLWLVEVEEGREAAGAPRTLHSCQLLPARFPGALSAEHSTHCADVCHRGKCVFKAECSKGSPLRAGWLSSLALSLKGRPDAGWEVSAVDRGTAC